MEPTITAAASAVAPLVASSNKELVSPTTAALSFNVDENKEADDGWNWDD